MTDSRLIDARGPRFAAAVTAIVLAVTLVVTPSVAAVVLLVLQALAFGSAAFLGIRYQPYGMFFRRVIAPRLGPPKHLEDPAPPRFAQSVGLVFVVAALVGLSFTLTLVAQIAIGFALAAAFLNAVFNFCLGCEMYLLIQRIRNRGSRRGKAMSAAAAPAGAVVASEEDVPAADEPLAVPEDSASVAEGPVAHDEAVPAAEAVADEASSQVGEDAEAEDAAVPAEEGVVAGDRGADPGEAAEHERLQAEEEALVDRIVVTESADLDSESIEREPAAHPRQ